MGEKVLIFETNDIMVKSSSGQGFNNVKFSYVYGKENIYFMLRQKYIAIQEYENSTIKNEYHYLYQKDEISKSDKITVENEEIVEYDNDFVNCKIVHSKQ